LKLLHFFVAIPDYPVGKHKAKVFNSALGITSKDTVWLIDQILEKLPECEAQEWYEDEFGIRYQSLSVVIRWIC